MLAITVGCAPAAVLAEQPSSAQLRELGGVVTAALTEPAPQTGLTHATPQRCPYHLDSDRPGRTFCVYRGAVFGRGGKVCATDVVVIWSSLASRAPVRGGRLAGRMRLPAVHPGSADVLSIERPTRAPGELSERMAHADDATRPAPGLRDCAGQFARDLLQRRIRARDRAGCPALAFNLIMLHPRFPYLELSTECSS